MMSAWRERGESERSGWLWLHWGWWLQNACFFVVLGRHFIVIESEGWVGIDEIAVVQDSRR